MTARRTNSREKILAAAAEVSRESGAGNLSLDAVAQRAGVSKGGLLYNFPTKAKLMQALVQYYLDDYEVSMARETDPNSAMPKTALQAHIEFSREFCEKPPGAASGILAAMADDPHFLDPLCQFKRRLLDRLKSEARDPLRALMCFLVLEGMTSLDLFEMDVLSNEERELVLVRLAEEAEADKNHAAASA
ncbi:TetR/AcrR family transcriptional regulator [Oryzicola mucosus]|uniref:TetR/AcrR family transcriptional regulator n=1 Tax=Oryzicola mucosus TaxID=2767425 RepID=A0A8J6U0T1_9HYPH|nr:TetR/AcrR family transcriptional regulator [Oryzicola mucosus]